MQCKLLVSSKKKIRDKKVKEKRQPLKKMLALDPCEWACSDSLHHYGKAIVANAKEIHSSLSQCERNLEVHLY